MTALTKSGQGNLGSKIRLNSNHLKMIAIIAMTIDHLTDLFFPSFSIHPVAISMHLIGRLTAPIMWFFICEGFYYTKNLRKYISRMFILAIISHFAYNFAFGINLIPFSNGDIFNQTSVIWPLAWSLVALYVEYKTNLKRWQKFIITVLITIITFPSDWSCIAVLAILSIYRHREDGLKKQTICMMGYVIMYAVISFFFVNKGYGIVQIGVLLVYPFMKMYNGERGKAKWMKWLFYIYYPLHLFITGLIRMLVLGGNPILF